MSSRAAGRGSRLGRVWLGIALLMVGLNLRPAIVAISPLLKSIEAATGLSSAMAGLLTALPVLCFGVFAPFASRLARRVGMEASLLGVLLLLAGGFAVRLAGSVTALFLGTFFVGVAIAIGNVLLPGVIKRDFPDRPGLMTGLYSTVLVGGGALSAGVTVPVQQAASFGWRPALAMWGLLVIIALACWTPRLRTQHRDTAVLGRAHGVRGLWRERLAWQVSLFMGLQSLNYYTMVSWLPNIFSDHGMSAGQAGWMLSLCSVFGIVGALGAPVLPGHGRNHGWLVAASCALCVASAIGLIVAPLGGAYVWMAMLGLGQGSTLALALTFIVLRSPDARHAADLSSMAQSIGYLIASVGPLAFGVLHDVAGGWNLSLVVLTALVVPEVVFGLLAARDRLVGRHERQQEVMEPESGRHVGEAVPDDATTGRQDELSA